MDEQIQEPNKVVVKKLHQYFLLQLQHFLLDSFLPGHLVEHVAYTTLRKKMKHYKEQGYLMDYGRGEDRTYYAVTNNLQGSLILSTCTAVPAPGPPAPLMGWGQGWPVGVVRDRDGDGVMVREWLG
jgi:hypothetical protein